MPNCVFNFLETKPWWIKKLIISTEKILTKAVLNPVTATLLGKLKTVKIPVSGFENPMPALKKIIDNAVDNDIVTNP